MRRWKAAEGAREGVALIAASNHSARRGTRQNGRADLQKSDLSTSRLIASQLISFAHIATVYYCCPLYMRLSLTQSRESRMDMDERISRVKDLIQKREEVDAELAGLFGISVKTKKTLRCSKCGEEGHNTKTCSSQQQQPSTE
jgi:hypothetical protein